MPKKRIGLTQRHDDLVAYQMKAYEQRRQEETARIMAETGASYLVAYKLSEKAMGGTAGNNNYVWPFMDD